MSGEGVPPECTKEYKGEVGKKLMNIERMYFLNGRSCFF